MKQTRGQEEKHQREGIQRTGPEVVVGFVDVRCVRHEDDAAHDTADERNTVRH